MIPTPTLDGETVVLGDLRMTADEAYTLANRLNHVARDAQLAEHGRLVREKTAAVVASYRRANPGALEIGPLIIRIHADLPHELHAMNAETGRSVYLHPAKIPTHPRIRYRSVGSPVTHLWQGGATAMCGKDLGDPGGPGGSRECEKCKAKANNMEQS